MINDELIYELSEFTDTEKVKQISKRIDETNNQSEIASAIEELQEINNTIYEKIGFNAVTLDFQVYINELRQEFDVTDPREVMNTDNGKGFVQ